MDSFTQRISALRCMPYQEYLRTPEWLARREQAVAFAEGRCQLCNQAGELHVHHRTYERRGAELPKDLIVLCAHCHALFHDKLPDSASGESDETISLPDAERLYDILNAIAVEFLRRMEARTAYPIPCEDHLSTCPCVLVMMRRMMTFLHDYP